jgi:alpha-mannosidase
MTDRPVHYILSTHWDREWYQTFQDFRHRLVGLIDRVLQGLADGSLHGTFQADGQAIVVEDYLEVHPERCAELTDYIRQGRFSLGPWYVLPDEFLVSGESLIRNLELGHRVTESYGGKPAKGGFMCDMFGHNSQMPQIFAGFGINGGFIWRGTNLNDQRLVRWRGADGSEMLCYRFGKIGYCDFAVQVRHANKDGYQPEQEQVLDDLDQFLQNESNKTQIGPLLAFDGGDHMEWDQQVYAILRQFSTMPGSGFQWKHSSFDMYLEELYPYRQQVNTFLDGELREPGKESVDTNNQWLIPGVLSSRVWIKQDNAACQSLLTQWAEPFTAFAHFATGRQVPQGFIDSAWKWLIANHPHDSMCGCSIDAVHEDMHYRFNQCKRIAWRQADEAMRDIAAAAGGQVGENEVRLAVFNPMPQPFAGVTELELEVPVEWPTFNEFFGFEPKPAFRLYDLGGKEMPYERLAQTMNQPRTRIHQTTFPAGYRVNVVRVAVRVNIPALGYTTLVMRPGQQGEPTRHPAVPGLATSDRSMENEAIAVTIESNGSLTLTEKTSGQVYTRLLTFEDCADIGDGWFHGMAVNDQLFTSSAGQASVALVHNGPLQTTFRVVSRMALPAEFDFASMQRSAHWGEITLDSHITLRPSQNYLEVETRLNNQVKDHRLRVLFPNVVSGASGAQTSSFISDTPFDVVERVIPLRADNHLYRELEVEGRPQQTFSAIFSNERGLAVVAPGLLETAAPDLPERPLALTLLRSTRRTVGTAGEPDGQLQGDLRFNYCIVPLSATHQPDAVALSRLGQQMGAGLHLVHLSREDFYSREIPSSLPASSGLLTVSGDVVLSSLRQMGTELEIRLWNPTNQVALATILQTKGHPGKSFQQAQPVNFLGSPQGQPVSFVNDEAGFDLGAKCILTLRIS